MYDVFISYSTRGATTKEWLINFTEELKKFYYLNYSKKLKVWYAIRENNVGDDFEEKVYEAIKQSLVFLMILDPAYIQSPETIKEVTKYEDTRNETNEPKNYISVIKWRGNKEAELKSFIDSNLIVCYFSEYNKDNNEEEFDEKSNLYKNAIQNIAKAIRKRELEESRKINAKKLLNILSEIIESPKVYVAFGNTRKNIRSQLVNQLTKTLERDDNLKDVKVLPDYLTSGASEDHLSSEDLTELLYDENPEGEKCLQAMLNASSFAIVPFLSDKTNEAEELIIKIQYQLNKIKSKSKETDLAVTVFADIPKELYELQKFNDYLDISQYKNAKLFKESDIGSFIASYMVQLDSAINHETVQSEKKEKHIYIVEHYNHNNEYNKDATDEKEIKQMELEIQNRRNLRKYIFSKDFVLIPSININASLLDAIQYHKKSLSISDGIIIYRGIREEPSWCIQQQSETYNIILDLGKEKKKTIEKAVYVDPLQRLREREDYFYYKYDVILDHPKELDDFLCKIQKQ